VAAGQLNSDGNMDLAVTNFMTSQGPGGVSLQAGNGDGTFSTGLVIPLQANPSAIAARDFNHDHKTDLVVADYNGAAVLILLHL